MVLLEQSFMLQISYFYNLVMTGNHPLFSRSATTEPS